MKEAGPATRGPRERFKVHLSMAEMLDFDVCRVSILALSSSSRGLSLPVTQRRGKRDAFANGKIGRAHPTHPAGQNSFVFSRYYSG